MYNIDDESTKLAGTDAILDSKPPFQHHKPPFQHDDNNKLINDCTNMTINLSSHECQAQSGVGHHV